MKWWGIVLIITIFLSGCSNLDLSPTPVDDGFEHFLWVGDDQLQTGPLDMQTLLLLELAGDSQSAPNASCDISTLYISLII